MQAQVSQPTTVNHKPRVRRGYNPHVFYVDSRSNPGQIHMVMTVHGGHCTCPSWRHRGRCAHVTFCSQYDAALARLDGGAA